MDWQIELSLHAAAADSRVSKLASMYAGGQA